MASKSGIWIDTKKALIVKITDENKTFKVIDSGIETKERKPGEGKKFGRFANQFLSFEKQKQRKQQDQEKRYFKAILSELKNVEEVVLFGPSNTKNRFQKEILSNKSLKIVLNDLEDADSMTDNQVSAWVVDYYKK